MENINLKKALVLGFLVTGSFACDKNSKDLERTKIVKSKKVKEPQEVPTQKMEEPKVKVPEKIEEPKVKVPEKIEEPKVKVPEKIEEPKVKVPEKVGNSKKKETAKELEQPKKIQVDRLLTLKEVLTLKSQTSSYKALSVKFKEKLYRDLRKKTREKEGSAYFIRPNKFLWKVGDLKSKTKQFWIYNGLTLLQHNTEDKHAIRYGANLSKSKELNRLVGYLVNFKELFASHNLIEAVEKGQKINLKLETKEKTNIKSILISLAVKEKEKKKIVSLESLQIFYYDKNNTSFDFETFKEEKVDETKLKLHKEIKISDAIK